MMQPWPQEARVPTPSHHLFHELLKACVQPVGRNTAVGIKMTKTKKSHKISQLHS